LHLGGIKMKIKIMAFALLAIFMLPAAFAQTNANTQADIGVDVSAEATTMTDVRFKKMGESVNDLFFNVRSSMTFRKEARIELIEQRNEVLKERQKAWLEMKQSAFAEAEGESKKEVALQIRQRHELIIKEHLELTSRLRNIAIEANSSNDVQLNQRARVALERVESSNMMAGLEIAANARARNENNASSTGLETAAKARAKVESRLGLNAISVDSQTRSGVDYFVVTSTDEDASEDNSAQGNYEVWIRKSDGVISSIDVKSTITTALNINDGTDAQASTRTNTSTNNGGVQSETRIGVSLN
jgi:hypothetical protein